MYKKYRINIRLQVSKKEETKEVTYIVIH